MEWLAGIMPIVLFIGGGVGYLVRRHFEKKGDDEAIERQRKALELKKAMDEAGVTPDALHSFTDAVAGRVKMVRVQEDKVSALLEGDDALVPLTQLEMNHAQQSRAQQASLVLERVQIEYSDELDRDEAMRLQAAMDAWEVLAENHAQLAGLMFRGGSMAPMAYWAERERMTVTRIAELQAQIAERRELRSQ